MLVRVYRSALNVLLGLIALRGQVSHEVVCSSPIQALYQSTWRADLGLSVTHFTPGPNVFVVFCNARWI
jgi:hypothetical protein